MRATKTNDKTCRLVMTPLCFFIIIIKEKKWKIILLLQKMEIAAFKDILAGRKSIKGRKDYENTFTLNGV